MAIIKIESYKSLFIEMYFNETRLASGTGFIVNSTQGDPLLITNRHNVTGKSATGETISETGGIPNQVKIFHRNSEDMNQVTEKIEKLYANNEIFEDERVWFEHPTYGAHMDCIALKLTELDGVHLLDYNLDEGNFYDKGVTDTVSVIGYPFEKKAANNTAIWATGFIATEPELNFEDMPIFLIDCRSRQGQSGSPVISYKLSGDERQEELNIFFGTPTVRFLGIYSGRINANSDLGIVWKASAIQELINSVP